VIYSTHPVTFLYLPTTTTVSGSVFSTVTANSPSKAIVTISQGAQVDARNIEIKWQSTDQVVLDWLTSQKSNSTAPASPSTHSHNLSSGAIAGIILGALLFLSLIVLGVWLFLRRRKTLATESDEQFNTDPGKFPCFIISRH
jgi:hypothetical protein